MLIERVEQRVLGAMCLLDRATSTPLMRPMRVVSSSARVLRNAHGLYVITEADGLAAHSQAFLQPPANPPLGANSYDFAIHDPQGRYLPRLVSVSLPRDPDPNHTGNSNSLFTPLEVTLYPASTAPLSANWSSVRVSLSQGPDPQSATPLVAALLRIVDPAESRILASGLSDQRGEALVIVPGVPVTKFADEGDAHDHGHHNDSSPVVVNTLPVRLELSWQAGTPWPPDPAELEANHAARLKTTRDLVLRSGRMERVVINLT